MDLLFKRYASPFLLVDQMLLTGQFSNFVVELTEMDADDNLWQFFLHKVDGQSFDQWKQSLGNQSEGLEVSKDKIETTINDSFSILTGFEPIT